MNKKEILLKGTIFLSTSALLMIGCGTTQENGTKSSVASPDNISSEIQVKIETESSETISDTTETSFPEIDPKDTTTTAVEDFHASFKGNLENNYPQYTLSKIKEKSFNNSKFYEFDINTKEGYTQPNVTFQNNNHSFSITLPDEIDNETLKNIIICTIMSVENTINIESASSLMKNLANSFDGSSNSSIVSTENYKFYISSGSGLLSSRRLNVISVLEINPSINKEEYIPATNELFSGELNQGTNAYFKGTVLGIYDLDTNWGLEVSNGNDIYCVYYNFDNFIDCIEIGNTYTFYGQIAASRNDYSGCLRLDYLSNDE